MTRRATATSTVGGVHWIPKIGVLIPLILAAISVNFTVASLCSLPSGARRVPRISRRAPVVAPPRRRTFSSLQTRGRRAHRDGREQPLVPQPSTPRRTAGPGTDPAGDRELPERLRRPR